MKITLDTQFNGSFGPVTLREAVKQLKAHELDCTIPRETLDVKVSIFSECVERGFTPLRGEIMAAYYTAEHDAVSEAFGEGLITEGELRQKQLDLSRIVVGSG
ncbi:hypothetical protein OIE66_32915 [Nonomuraea sp. NBC_01738]|uniref:hypothetical protein n=1 Tax=Nonomuraea sp. NBC_01738 TaxID=2976003 RepID=UPI002E124E1A|nr:hypothetical protein OIE66_32915 [Nonomuraea sp. NBC_01738]